MMNYFLTIAASDNSGGAGIQQDIKVAYQYGYWPLSAITGITVQDFYNVYKVEPVKPELLKEQIEQCFESFPVKTVKIGAICSHENLNIIVSCLKKYTPCHVVLDTVLFSSSGASFLNNSSYDVMKETLFPLTELITPNKIEFELLTNQHFSSINQAINIAKEVCKQWKTSILIKGGHFSGTNLCEALVSPTDVLQYKRPKKNFQYSHGTGCTLSSAMACNLGMGKTFNESYLHASQFLVDYYEKMQQNWLKE